MSLIESDVCVCACVGAWCLCARSFMRMFLCVSVYVRMLTYVCVCLFVCVCLDLLSAFATV